MPTKAQLTKSLDRYQAQLAEAERQRDEAIRVARHQEQSLKESQAQTASANSQITDLQERLSRIRDAIATAAERRLPPCRPLTQPTRRAKLKDGSLPQGSRLAGLSIPPNSAADS